MKTNNAVTSSSNNAAFFISAFDELESVMEDMAHG